MLQNKFIALGITGSIASYKIFELIKLLRGAGAKVQPVMTKNSLHFLTPLSIEISCGNKVLVDAFEVPMSHIELAKNSDIFVVAPATANFINKYANGIADDLLTTSILGFRGPVVIAPAMNWRMYEAPQTKKSIEFLKSIGVIFVEPEKGNLACGEEGIGRLASVEKIFELILDSLTEKDLRGEYFLITAGPTRHYIDRIRFITNISSGKMGYSLARIAKRRGAKVTLISGPSFLTPPNIDEFIHVETTEEMLNAVMSNIEYSTTLIMAAAPLDFEPGKIFNSKIDKTQLSSIKLKLCPDILKEVSKIKKELFTVGFAAEWGENLERAIKKLKEKSLDMIVLNDISDSSIGMCSDFNRVTIIYRSGNEFIQEKTPTLSKDEISSIILSKIRELKLVR